MVGVCGGCNSADDKGGFYAIPYGIFRRRGRERSERRRIGVRVGARCPRKSGVNSFISNILYYVLSVIASRYYCTATFYRECRGV